ncbi:DeoR/GlpR family DNA-binding transcription regulator [Lacibacterium aquatile]|uniref:DeoR/GlpR family DNA-binding transcription regulator n=1 Tax=Lacibacterium aquatile TaxID=1168082 RepID=A0ABW5DL97_9PROT
MIRSPEERRRMMMDLLEREGRLQAASLAVDFDVSEDTIRRDLAQLAEAGVVQRVHGGAVPASTGLDPYLIRRRRGGDAKRAIAQAAASMIRDRQIVFLSGGTTLELLARSIPPLIRVTVVTPSAPVAIAAADHPQAEVIIIGGRLDKTDLDTGGAVALEALRGIRCDMAFLGVCGIDIELGLTGTTYEGSALKRAAIAASGEAVALATIDKLGAAGPYHVDRIGAVSTLITEAKVPEGRLQPYRDTGLTVVAA